MPHAWTTWVGVAFYLAVCLFALVAGGRPERSAAAAFLTALALANMTHERATDALQLGGLLIDAGMLAVLGGLMLGTQRRWTIWATAYQLLAVMVHLARLIDRGFHEKAYLTATIGFGYGTLIALGYGVWEARRFGGVGRRRGSTDQAIA